MAKKRQAAEVYVEIPMEKLVELHAEKAVLEQSLDKVLALLESFATDADTRRRRPTPSPEELAALPRHLIDVARLVLSAACGRATVKQLHGGFDKMADAVVIVEWLLKAWRSMSRRTLHDADRRQKAKRKPSDDVQAEIALMIALKATGKKMHEIASELDITEDAAKKRLQRKKKGDKSYLSSTKSQNQREQ
jgi:hypothetical protein